MPLPEPLASAPLGMVKKALDAELLRRCGLRKLDVYLPAPGAVTPGLRLLLAFRLLGFDFGRPWN